MADKTLLLGLSLFKKQHQPYVTLEELYKPVSTLGKALRRVHFNSALPAKKIWMNELGSQVEAHDTIILSAKPFSFHVARVIDQLGIKGKRFIFWYWNPVALMGHPAGVSQNWESWSFDRQDAKQYGLKYNGTYYFDSFVHETAAVGVPETDVYFIGQDKSRFEILKTLEQQLAAQGVRTDIHIVRDRTSAAHNRNQYRPKADYAAILQKVAGSKALLDICQEGQTGMTQRVMEALFFGKKLITNNPALRDEDFYHPDHIHILGEDASEAIPAFIEKPVAPVPDAVRDSFLFRNWLRRLLEDKPLQP